MLGFSFSRFVLTKSCISSCDSISFLSWLSSTFIEIPEHGFIRITPCSTACFITFLKRAYRLLAPSPTLLLCKYSEKDRIISLVI